ncbi:MAG TPA: hypothetical protein VGC37_02595 [Friedmanniella sp.]
MNWKLAAVVGACAGGVVWVVRRRTRRPADDGEWAAATDRVAPVSV